MLKLDSNNKRHINIIRSRQTSFENIWRRHQNRTCRNASAMTILRFKSKAALFSCKLPCRSKSSILLIVGRLGLATGKYIYACFLATHNNT